MRLAGVRDARKIYEIYSSELEALDPESYDWLEAFIRVRSKRGRVLVAEMGGEIVGFAVIYKHRDEAYISAIAVDRDFRGMGVGSSLLEEAQRILSEEGARRLSLSVKSDNLAALDFYLRRGFAFRRLVLLMEAEPTELPERAEEGYSVRLGRAGRVRFSRLRPTAWWWNLTESVDRLVYKKFRGRVGAVLVYRGSMLRGAAEYTPDGKLLVDYLAVSSYSLREALRALLVGLRRRAEEFGAEAVRIPVDATKSGITAFLVECGFGVSGSEYVLEKSLEQRAGGRRPLELGSSSSRS